MCYELPKIWQGRIKKYWDRTIPANYPASDSKFSLTFATAEEKAAVEKFEEELGTDESVVKDFIPEDSFLSGYLGVYDVSGIPGEKVLLNPEKVTSEDPFKVLHFVNDEWTEVTDVELIDGYIWGTLEEFSPIAVVFSKKEIEITTLPWFVGDIVVGNGNPVSIISKEDGKCYMVNKSSGKELVIPDSAKAIIGGTADGTDLKESSIVVDNVDNANLNVYAGSFFYNGEEEGKHSVNVDVATIKVVNSKIRSVNVSYGGVRTKQFNCYCDGLEAFFTASGYVTISKIGKDANGSMDLSLASNQWVKNANLEFKNAKVTWLYTGGNSGYSYTVNATCKLDGCVIDGGITCGGSNGRSENVTMEIINTESVQCQSVNRGIVNNVSVKVKDSDIKELAALGSSDDDVTGIIEGSSTLNVDGGTYKLIVGRYGEGFATNADHINYVKISRSADYEISNEDLAILGDKFIVK